MTFFLFGEEGSRTPTSLVQFLGRRLSIESLIRPCRQESVELAAFENFTRDSKEFFDHFSRFIICRQNCTCSAFFDDNSKAVFVYGTRAYLPCLVQPEKVAELAFHLPRSLGFLLVRYLSLSLCSSFVSGPP